MVCWDPKLKKNMRVLVLLALAFAAVAAVPTSDRIIGGSLATISDYPTIVALLYSRDFNFYSQACGGTIINPHTILTAAHCLIGDAVNRWRARVGSSFGNSGGTVHVLQSYLLHPQYNVGASLNNDVALIRTSTSINYINNAVQPATIAGTNYNPADNSVVWAAGWGSTYVGGPTSAQLRHVQVWTVNQQVCADRYSTLRYVVTENMLCSGWLDVGGRDQCQGDSGGPLYHNGVVIGVCSWGQQCALARYPGVNARVSRFTTWIQNNA